MKLEHRLSALLQLHLHSQLHTWLQWIGQRQLQDETRNIYIWGIGAFYIRDLTVIQDYSCISRVARGYVCMPLWPAGWWHQRAVMMATAAHLAFSVVVVCVIYPCHSGHCDKTLKHDDVIKWEHFPRYWPFVRGIHRSPVNSPHKGQWRGALIFFCV